MTKLTVVIDGIHGTVRMTAQSEAYGRQQIDLRWCNFGGSPQRTGFMTSISDEPIFVTEVAAEQFIRMVLYSIANALADSDDFHIVIHNHMSESLRDIEFMPPTFEGGESDIDEFVSKQDAVKNLFAIYDETGALSTAFMDACAQEDVLEDMLCLLHVKASGFSIPIKPSDTNFEG